ncbi:MAG TPA: ABC transporter ATP-binding protein, partial [Stenomitos sp.]
MSTTELNVPLVDLPEDEDTPENLIGLVGSIRRLLGYFVGYPGPVAFMVFILILEMGFTALIPLGLKVLIDQAIPKHDQPTMLLTLGGLSAAVVVISLTGVALDWVFFKAVARIMQDLRLRLYTHLQQLSLNFFRRKKVPNILATFSGDLAPIEQVVALTAAGFVAPVMDLFMSVGLIFTLDWRLALVAMLIWPLTLLGPRFVSPHASLASYRYKTEEAKVLSYVEENLSAQEVIKAFALEKHAVSGFRRHAGLLMQRGARMGFLSGSVERSAFIGISIFQVLVIAVGAYLAFLGQITVGTFVSFQALTATLSSAVAIVMNFLPGLLKAAGGMQRLEDILAEAPSVVDAPNARELKGIQEGVSLKGVSFAYSGHDPCIQDVSFEIPKGKVTALVGTGGSGKSSVVNLLLRYYEPSSGSLVIDGQDAREFTQASLRSRVSILTATSVFFSNSVKENIRLGKLSATDEEVLEAARAAGVHDFIQGLPQGYDTPIGENGARLTNEEALRLALARALVRKPDLLILDEATSALDSQAEQSFLATISSRELGVLLATHRLATVVRSDRIIVLNHGRVVQEGEHHELLSRDGEYRRMWEKQSGFATGDDGYFEVEIDWLRRLPLFSSLDEKQLAEIAGQ